MHCREKRKAPRKPLIYILMSTVFTLTVMRVFDMLRYIILVGQINSVSIQHLCLSVTVSVCACVKVTSN